MLNRLRLHGLCSIISQSSDLVSCNTRTAHLILYIRQVWNILTFLCTFHQNHPQNPVDSQLHTPWIIHYLGLHKIKAKTHPVSFDSTVSILSTCKLCCFSSLHVHHSQSFDPTASVCLLLFFYSPQFLSFDSTASVFLSCTLCHDQAVSVFQPCKLCLTISHHSLSFWSHSLPAVFLSWESWSFDSTLWVFWSRSLCLLTLTVPLLILQPLSFDPTVSCYQRQRM